MKMQTFVSSLFSKNTNGARTRLKTQNRFYFDTLKSVFGMASLQMMEGGFFF